MSPVTCISGIDTDIGKSVVVGLMARFLLSTGQTVVTQKAVQTGCTGISEDILSHRKMMGIDLLPDDLDGLTCPYVFKKPCSPHLAAELEGKHILPDTIRSATRKLTERYEHVLLEGVGGLQVPLTRNFTFLDYIEQQNLPLILVTVPRLGSVNHTLSALELLQRRGISVKGIVYNCYGEQDEEIRRDSGKVFLEYLDRYGFPKNMIELQDVEHYFADGRQFDCRVFFEE